MKWIEDKVSDLKIAYIGGGSRGWAWGLMSDLAVVEDMSGKVSLYDIDQEAAKKNEVIGNRVKEADGCKTVWEYEAVNSLQEALTGADFVVISIMPGTFDEMESDVHTPESYGIYQSVGDTAGPGGILRALRCLPMFEEFAQAIKNYCPDAWVINYTNPMTVCVRTLYRVFPQIKAFGCCHEVFGTQNLLAVMLGEMCNEKNVQREDIKVNVLGVNHFTWLTEAKYHNQDLMPIYQEFAHKNQKEGFQQHGNANWMNQYFKCSEKVKFDLFLRFGSIAAAGDRHLAEFCPGKWYLKDPDTIREWGFAITPVFWRKKQLQERLERSNRLYQGEENFELKNTGEEGVQQMRALLGLRDLTTNVNIPNLGQIPNLPLGAVVETNAYFSADNLRPVMAGSIPTPIYSLISRVCGEQELLVEAVANRDLEGAFQAFCMDPNMDLPLPQARELFHKMLENTKTYLHMYGI